MADKSISITVDPRDAVDGLEEIMRGFGKLRKTVAFDMKAMRSGFVADLKRMWSFAKSTFSNIGKAWKKFTSLVGGAKNLFQAVGVAAFVNETVKASVLFEKVASTLTVVTGSYDAAQDHIEGLVEMTQRLGISFEHALPPFAKFFAAARGSLNDTEILGVFEAFGKAAVSLQLNSQEIQGVFLALQQIASKGRVSMEELRLQLAERIPGAMQLAADAMGMTIRQLEDEIRKGALASGDFLKRFAEKVDIEFSAAAEAASKTTLAFINRFHTAWLLFLNDIGEGGLTESVKNSLGALTTWLGEAEGLANSLGRVMGFAIEKATELVTSLSPEDIQTALEFIVQQFIDIKDTLAEIAGSPFWKFFFGGGEDSETIKALKEDLGSLTAQRDSILRRPDFLSGFGLKDMDKVDELNRKIKNTLELMDKVRAAEKVDLSGFFKPEEGDTAPPLTEGVDTPAQMLTLASASYDANQAVARLNATESLAGKLKIVNQELANSNQTLKDQLGLMNDTNLAASDRIAASQRIPGIVDEIDKKRKEQLSLQKQINAEIAREVKLIQTNANFLASVDRALEKTAKEDSNIFRRIREASQEVRDLRVELTALSMETNEIDMTADQKNTMSEKLKDLKAAQTELNKATSDMKGFADQMGNSFSSAFEEATLAGKEFSEVLQGLAEDIARLVMRQTISAPIASAISGGITNMISGGGASLSGIAGVTAGSQQDTMLAAQMQGFANGGVSTGGFYRVGENGEEVVSLPPGSRVIPNNRTGGGVSINIENNGTETEVDTQQQPDGSMLINLINSTVSQSISSGGEVSRAMGSAFGSQQRTAVR